MPDLTILDRKVFFDRQLVAELHPSLAEGTRLHGAFLAALRDGADFDYTMEEMEKAHDAECERLEDEIGEAEEDVYEARAERDDAKTDLQTLATLVAGFLAGPGSVSAELVREHFGGWPEVIDAFEEERKGAS